MPRARVVAMCAALSAGTAVSFVSTGAAAQEAEAEPDLPHSGLVARGQLQGAYAHALQNGLKTDDYWVDATPQLTAIDVHKRWLLTATYAFTGSLHTYLPDSLANHLGVGATADLTPRTNIILTADANQTTISNLLVANPAAATPLGAIPPTNTKLVTLSLAEIVSWEASPVVRLGETVDGTFVTSFDSDTPLRNYIADLALSADRVWKNDALGVEAKETFAESKTTVPAIEQTLVVSSLSGRWRHDFSLSWSSLVSAGPSFIFSPDAHTRPAIAPSAQALLSYTTPIAHAEVGYQYGFLPNPITGQLIRSHVVQVRGAIPLSQRNNVTVGAGVGFTRSSFIDLRADAPDTPSYNAVLSDVELSWSPLGWLELFARYQFLGQSSGAGVLDGELLRDTFLVGAAVTTSTKGTPTTLSIRAPVRVDRSDGTSLAPVAPAQPSAPTK